MASKGIGFCSANKCLDSRPTTQSVLFCGKFISLTALAFSSCISISHLSLIFAGKRQPSLATAEKIAQAIGVDWCEFLKALKEHVRR
jgi:transcriptional regulator with XRE-family HTH domain